MRLEKAARRGFRSHPYNLTEVLNRHWRQAVVGRELTKPGPYRNLGVIHCSYGAAGYERPYKGAQ